MTRMNDDVRHEISAPADTAALHARRHPVHLPNLERAHAPVILFVTVCSHDRRPILACDGVHEALRKAWAAARLYPVGHYVVMPDHVHLFCRPAVFDPGNVGLWVAYWKRLASTDLKETKPLWQRDCWDTQLRTGESYGEKWLYVQNNPVRAGLAARAEEWPYQGCLNDLRW
jgi:REP element-mobilizing transposase RayT